jgi:predicted O-methyltransferase YrrM
MSGYLFSLGFLYRKNRRLLWTICEHFGYGGSKVSPILPKCSTSDLLAETEPILVLCPDSVEGNVSLQELILLVHIVKKHRPQTLLEIGTFDGRTALNLAANSTEDAKVYTLDLPIESAGETKWPLLADEIASVGRYRGKLRFNGSVHEHKIVRLYGDSALFDFSALPEKVDLVFIDGSHRYEYVMNDTQKCLSVLRATDGVVIWHDYGAWDGVTRAVNDLYRSDRKLNTARHVEGTTLAYAVV